MGDGWYWFLPKLADEEPEQPIPGEDDEQGPPLSPVERAKINEQIRKEKCVKRSS